MFYIIYLKYKLCYALYMLYYVIYSALVGINAIDTTTVHNYLLHPDYLLDHVSNILLAPSERWRNKHDRNNTTSHINMSHKLKEKSHVIKLITNNNNKDPLNSNNNNNTNKSGGRNKYKQPYMCLLKSNSLGKSWKDIITDTVLVEIATTKMKKLHSISVK